MQVYNWNSHRRATHNSKFKKAIRGLKWAHCETKPLIRMLLWRSSCQFWVGAFIYTYYGFGYLWSSKLTKFSEIVDLLLSTLWIPAIPDREYFTLIYRSNIRHSSEKIIEKPEWFNTRDVPAHYIEYRFESPDLYSLMLMIQLAIKTVMDNNRKLQTMWY